MTIIRMLCSPAAVVLAIAACAAGAPVQVQRENIGLDNAAFSPPELAEALARTYEAIGVPAPHHVNPVNGPHRSQQAHRSLDSMSRPAFDDIRRFEHHVLQNIPYKPDFNRELMRNALQMEALSKRNFDEIDRTNFDSFVKRKSNNNPSWEMDEIDLSGLDNFARY